MADEDDFTSFEDVDLGLELLPGDESAQNEPDLDEAIGVDKLDAELVPRCTGDEEPPTEAQQAETFEEVDEDAE